MSLRSRMVTAWETVVAGVGLLILGGMLQRSRLLVEDVQSLGFEGSFEFLVERRVGPEQCLAADCPAIVRYYLSQQDLGATCQTVGSSPESTDDPDDPIWVRRAAGPSG